MQGAFPPKWRNRFDCLAVQEAMYGVDGVVDVCTGSAMSGGACLACTVSASGAISNNNLCESCSLGSKRSGAGGLEEAGLLLVGCCCFCPNTNVWRSPRHCIGVQARKYTNHPLCRPACPLFLPPAAPLHQETRADDNHSHAVERRHSRGAGGPGLLPPPKLSSHGGRSGFTSVGGGPWTRGTCGALRECYLWGRQECVQYGSGVAFCEGCSWPRCCADAKGRGSKA